jgi:hypothetical protein
MRIEIELIETESTETVFSGWKVTYGDKYADGLCYDEMLGLVATITMPEDKRNLQWLRTAEQHQAWRERLTQLASDVNDVDFEEIPAES